MVIIGTKKKKLRLLQFLRKNAASSVIFTSCEILVGLAEVVKGHNSLFLTSIQGPVVQKF